MELSRPDFGVQAVFNTLRSQIMDQLAINRGEGDPNPISSESFTDPDEFDWNDLQVVDEDDDDVEEIASATNVTVPLSNGMADESRKTVGQKQDQLNVKSTTEGQKSVEKKSDTVDNAKEGALKKLDSKSKKSMPSHHTSSIAAMISRNASASKKPGSDADAKGLKNVGHDNKGKRAGGSGDHDNIVKDSNEPSTGLNLIITDSQLLDSSNANEVDFQPDTSDLAIISPDPVKNTGVAKTTQSSSDGIKKPVSKKAPTVSRSSKSSTASSMKSPAVAKTSGSSQGSRRPATKSTKATTASDKSKKNESIVHRTSHHGRSGREVSPIVKDLKKEISKSNARAAKPAGSPSNVTNVASKSACGAVDADKKNGSSKPVESVTDPGISTGSIATTPVLEPKRTKALPEIEEYVAQLLALFYDHKKYSSFYCSACRLFFTTTLAWETHLATTDHKEKCTVWRQCEDLLRQSFQDGPSAGQKEVDSFDGILVGADNMIEICNSDSGAVEQLICTLCCEVCLNSTDMIAHLASFGHIDNFMEQTDAGCLIYQPPQKASTDEQTGLRTIDPALQQVVLSAAEEYMLQNGRGQMKLYTGEKRLGVPAEQKELAQIEEKAVLSKMEQMFAADGEYMLAHKVISAAEITANKDYDGRVKTDDSKLKALIGLQYMIEVWSPNRRSAPVHYCTLCDYFVSDYLIHCCAMKHGIAYLDKEYKSVFQCILLESNDKTQFRRAFTLAKEKILDLEGRLARIEHAIQILTDAQDVFVGVNSRVMKNIIEKLKFKISSPPRKLKRVVAPAAKVPSKPKSASTLSKPTLSSSSKSKSLASKTKTSPGNSKAKSTTTATSSKASQAREKVSSDSSICRVYNSKNGCGLSERCHLQHRCWIDGCALVAPAYTHVHGLSKSSSGSRSATSKPSSSTDTITGSVKKRPAATSARTTTAVPAKAAKPSATTSSKRATLSSKHRSAASSKDGKPRGDKTGGTTSTTNNQKAAASVLSKYRSSGRRPVMPQSSSARSRVAPNYVPKQQEDLLQQSREFTSAEDFFKGLERRDDRRQQRGGGGGNRDDIARSLITGLLDVSRTTTGPLPTLISGGGHPVLSGSERRSGTSRDRDRSRRDDAHHKPSTRTTTTDHHHGGSGHRAGSGGHSSSDRKRPAATSSSDVHRSSRTSNDDSKRRKESASTRSQRDDHTSSRRGLASVKTHGSNSSGRYESRGGGGSTSRSGGHRSKATGANAVVMDGASAPPINLQFLDKALKVVGVDMGRQLTLSDVEMLRRQMSDTLFNQLMSVASMAAPFADQPPRGMTSSSSAKPAPQAQLVQPMKTSDHRSHESHQPSSRRLSSSVATFGGSGGSSAAGEHPQFDKLLGLAGGPFHNSSGVNTSSGMSVDIEQELARHGIMSQSSPSRPPVLPAAPNLAGGSSLLSNPSIIDHLNLRMPPPTITNRTHPPLQPPQLTVPAPAPYGNPQAMLFQQALLANNQSINMGLLQNIGRLLQQPAAVVSTPQTNQQQQQPPKPTFNFWSGFQG